MGLITTFLRPPALYTQKQEQHRQSSKAQTAAASDSNKSNNSSDLADVPVERELAAPSTINNVEFIPTLEFAVSKSSECTDCKSVEQCLVQCGQKQYDCSTSSSRLTYTIKKTSISLPNDRLDQQQQQQQQHVQSHQSTHQCRRGTSVSLADTEELLRQDVNQFNSLSDDITSTTTFSTFFDEPTSSISIEIMEGNSQKVNEQTAGTVRATTANTISSSEIDQHSIEEEIDEVLEVSETADAADFIPGLSKNVAVKRLFGLDLSLSEGSSELAKSQSPSLKNSTDDEQYKIDDDQLAGGKLAQHFLINEEEQTAKSSLNLDEVKISHLAVEKGEKKESQADDQEFSIDNESTADDVSDLIEEDKIDNELMSGVEDEPKNKQHLAKDLNRKALSETSSVHSEKDHSMEEIVATNHSIELSFDDKNLSSLNASFDINNETLTNQLLADTPQKPMKEKLSRKLVQEKTFDANKYRPSEENLCKGNSTSEKLKLLSMESAEVLNTEKFSDPGMKKQVIKTYSASTAQSSNYEAESTKENLNENIKSPSQLEIGGTNHSNQIKNLEAGVESINQCSISAKNIKQLPKLEASKGLMLKPANLQSDTNKINLNSIPLAEMITDLDDNVKEKSNQPKNVMSEQSSNESLNTDACEEEDEETSLKLMKLKILAMKTQLRDIPPQLSPSEVFSNSADSANQTKAMERVSLAEFSKDVLEDITEESERNSLSFNEEPASCATVTNTVTQTTTKTSESKNLCNNEEKETAGVSVVSLNMQQILEQKVEELQQVLATKDACLASLNLQLENLQRRESLVNPSSEQLLSGRDSSSLVTSSTDYRTFHEDFIAGSTNDIYAELSKRDELISKLTDSLQQSLTTRENLQAESEKLNAEVQILRKQLSEAMDAIRKSYWPRDQESNGGQRISEISMDLVSESDDDLERQFLTDNEDKHSRNSRERQLSMPRQAEYYPINEADVLMDAEAFSKQIEQFQKYLTPSEVRLFFMVQKKFDDYLSQELEKCKMRYDQELKIVMEQWDYEKREKEQEIQKLLQQREEKESKHAHEMEDLRKYFETKCVDLEKQFSDDVFSQKSQHQEADTFSSASECLDEELIPDDFGGNKRSLNNLSSPKKRSKAELLLSPSHRQITPSNDAFSEDLIKNQGSQLALEITDLKAFYQNKIREIRRTHEENLKKLIDKLKYYESRYPEDDFMRSIKLKSSVHDSIADMDDVPDMGAQSEPLATTSKEFSDHRNNNKDINRSSLIIIDQDELLDNVYVNNEAQVIQKIIDEYESRLQEQLALAKADIVYELEQQIQTLLSETTVDDQHWPKELILLREKLTAKSQLEVAQLQIKHAEEMSRLKLDYEKQLNRKNKRHSTFDSKRDFDKLLNEQESLRELTKSLIQVLAELAKCVANYENDLNETLMEEVQRLLSYNRSVEDNDEINFNSSRLFNTSLNNSSSSRLMPDVQNLLEVIEDPSLLQYVANKSDQLNDDFDLKDCLDKLRLEALYLLHLSEDLVKRKREQQNIERSESISGSEAEKQDSCCETELGKHKFLRVNSLNEQQLPTYQFSHFINAPQVSSLPPDLNRLQFESNSSNDANASELNFQLIELKNRLIKSESDRLKLQQELDLTINRNTELGEELQHLRDQLSQLSSLNHIDYNEGYGMGSIKVTSPRLSPLEHNSSNFAQLQEKARNILTTPTQKQADHDSTVQLLQMIEDFCREGDKVVEFNKREREDLQSQIDTADKQLKATRQFLEEQAAEREQERDEFLCEIENIKGQLRDKEKERSNYVNASEEVEQLEAQIRGLTKKLQDSINKSDKFEVELKASIDKIFVLREIISDLETQIEAKALNEHVMGEKVKELENYINLQNRSNDTLQSEVQSLRTEIECSYQMRVKQLEDKLQNIRPTAEQSLVLDQVVEQLRDIENSLDQKTKNLESLHHSNASNSGSLSATEDVSVHGSTPSSLPVTVGASLQQSPVHPSPRQHSLAMEGVQRIADKLSKHSRVEEASVKRIRDLEMQMTHIRAVCVELQHERESLQERMSEQTQRISALQNRLEEQRQRAEDLQRANTSDLNIRIHDLQTEVQNLRETLDVRDKQIAALKQQLEKSKLAIDRLEAELTIEHQPDRSAIERLENELKQKQIENQKLKEKIKNEMINKLALPDLMETMLADKNDEIDHLREQLETKENELQSILETNQTSSVGAVKACVVKVEESRAKLSARTLSDIMSISEFDEPDVVRRAAAQNMSSPLMVPEGSGGVLQQTIDSSKAAIDNLTHRREDLSGFNILQQANTFDHPHYFQGPNIVLGSAKSDPSTTPLLIPRQINFSAVTEDLKLRTPLQTPQSKTKDQELIENLKKEVNILRENMDLLKSEKEVLNDLTNCQKDLLELGQQVVEKSLEIEQLLREQDKLKKEKTELLSKNEKNLRNYEESEENHLKRIKEMEHQILENTEREVKERENLRKELQSLEEAHEQCKYTIRDNENRRHEIEGLNREIKCKDDRLLALSTKLSITEESLSEMEKQIKTLEREVEKLKQQSSYNSSKQFSVEEIAQQVEKELNYSAQLDSNILKAIESEEENNLDRGRADKPVLVDGPGTTDDENFAGERELLNQLSILKAQIAVEQELSEKIHKELLQEKQHSQEIQEQDVMIIESLRKRLEEVLEQEDELHKQLEIEKQRCESFQAQLFALKRTESRRSSALLKSPNESPRKSPRSLPDFESDFTERLRSEIKLLTAQNERERERTADLQKSSERERLRFEKELEERTDYCEKLKYEMEKVARDKENAELEIEHLQERLTLQTQEMESLEGRIASLQEAETRRRARKERQLKESAQLTVDLQERKTQLQKMESEREKLKNTIAQLRYDIECSAQREAKLSEALANANANLANRDGSQAVPEQFLQKMKEINALLAENTRENKQMSETVHYLVEERRQLQRKCDELESQVNGSANVSELEDRCNHLFGRYLRVESHRKALVYQKRYLKISLQSYVDSEQRALAACDEQHLLIENQKNKKKLFKIVALAIISIQRMKYIGRLWQNGKRIVSKSVFTITHQRRPQVSAISSTSTVGSTRPTSPKINSFGLRRNSHKPFDQTLMSYTTSNALFGHHHHHHQTTPSSATSVKAFDWPKVPTKQQPL
uniref:Pericentrin/AKAP-450 centrosomal targeting domain-containing protein n=1 Tax=Glossina morsitans morsitans TaxID=37546 RepID=A0A1B0GCZ9_GLOMM